MAGKRYDVCSPRKKKDGGTFWHRVGMAWEGEKGISIEFSSLPLPDVEGRVRVSLFEPREKQQQPDQQSGSDEGDHIPF